MLELVPSLVVNNREERQKESIRSNIQRRTTAAIFSTLTRAIYRDGGILSSGSWALFRRTKSIDSKHLSLSSYSTLLIIINMLC